MFMACSQHLLHLVDLGLLRIDDVLASRLASTFARRRFRPWPSRWPPDGGRSSTAATACRTRCPSTSSVAPWWPRRPCRLHPSVRGRRVPAGVSSSGFSFHCTRKTFMVSISGSWAAAICWASSISSGLVDRSGASADRSMACWWCGIMLVAKATSAALKPAGWPVITGVSAAWVIGVTVRCGRGAATGGQETARHQRRPGRRAMRAGMDVMTPPYRIPQRGIDNGFGRAKLAEGHT